MRGGCWFANAGPSAARGDQPGRPRRGCWTSRRGRRSARTCAATTRRCTCPGGPRDTLLLYTDGLVERRTEDIDTSLARLAGLSLPHAVGPLDAVLARIVHRLAPAAAEDDVALLAARARCPSYRAAPAVARGRAATYLGVRAVRRAEE